MRMYFSDKLSIGEVDRISRGGNDIPGYVSPYKDGCNSDKTLKERDVLVARLQHIKNLFPGLASMCSSALLAIAGFPGRPLSFSVETDRSIRDLSVSIAVTIELDAHEDVVVENSDYGRNFTRWRRVSHFVDPVNLASAPPPAPPPPKERRLTFRPRDLP